MMRYDPDRDRGLAAGAAAALAGATALEAALTAVVAAFDYQAASRSRARRIREFILRCRHRAVEATDDIVAAACEAAANEAEGRLADWLAMEQAASSRKWWEAA